MQNWIDFRKVKNVCKIETGFGRLAELLIFNQESISNYVIVGLCKTMSIRMAYLTKSVSGYIFYYIEEAVSIRESNFL